MKTSRSHYRRYLLFSLSCLVLAVLACSIPSHPGGFSTNTGNLLPDPSTGLARLQSYHAVYNLTLQGTIDGKPFDRQSHMEYSFITESKDEEIVWQEQSAGNVATFLHSIRVGNAVYSLSQDGQECWGEYVDQPSEAMAAPTSLLLPVSDANQVGSETVNGVAAQHYHFDQTGLLSTEQGASGEVWIAQQGGYVVKYTLSIPGPTTPTGKGTETTETVNYELEEVNSFTQISLPAGCVPVLVDFPAMADAQDIYRGSGYMDYTSPSNLVQVIDYYNQALPPLGWTAAESPFDSDQTESQALEYTQGDQDLTILLDSSSGSLEVSVILNKSALAVRPPTETPGPSPTTGLQQTVNPSQSGLPADVPLYPGATELANPGVPATLLQTADSATQVAQFYSQQMAANNWVLLSSSTTGGIINQGWQKDTRMAMITIQPAGSITRITIAIQNE